MRLLSEVVSAAFASSLSSRRIELVTVRTIDELQKVARCGPSLDLVVVDAIHAVNLEAIRNFHVERPDLPLLALGVREHGADIIAHGNAGFTSFVRREDGIERLCEAVEDVLAGRLTCSPEIAAAMMRALFRRGPIPVHTAGVPLTRRENDVALLVARGLSNKEIARELSLSESTVKHHVHVILSKFGVGTRGQLMRNLNNDLWRDGAPLQVGGEA
ncbi:MAG: LuxR C-terminal-related transcriptional regulator [Sandaracinobacter sp.]